MAATGTSFDPAEATGGDAFRCTRGCGAVVGNPEGQDQHNQDAHTTQPGGGTQYVGGQMAPSPQNTMNS